MRARAGTFSYQMTQNPRMHNTHARRSVVAPLKIIGRNTANSGNMSVSHTGGPLTACIEQQNQSQLHERKALRSCANIRGGMQGI